MFKTLDKKERKNTTRRRRGKVGSTVVSTLDELESALKIKGRRIVLAGELVTVSMNPLNNQEGIIQPNRYAEHSLLSQGKAMIHVSLPVPVADAIKNSGRKKDIELLLDKALRWMYRHSTSVSSFRLMLVYASTYSTVLEIFTITDRTVRSYDIRQIPGGIRDALMTVYSDSPLPIFYASPVTLDEPFTADDIHYSGTEPFRLATNKAIYFGDERHWMDWVMPACAVVAGLMIYWGVNYYQQSRLTSLKADFRQIISGVEDVYFAGGRDISLLQRQQYFIEDANSLRHYDMVRRIINAVASLRADVNFKRVTLENIMLPSYSTGFEFDVVLRNQKGNGSITMQTSQLVEALSRKGGLMVVTQRPAQDESVSGEPFLLYSLSIRRQDDVK